MKRMNEKYYFVLPAKPSTTNAQLPNSKGTEIRYVCLFLLSGFLCASFAADATTKKTEGKKNEIHFGLHHDKDSLQAEATTTTITKRPKNLCGFAREEAQP